MESDATDQKLLIICRTCTESKTPQEMMSLFTQKNGRCLVDMLMDVASIQFNSDTLTTMICQQCTELLEITDSFRRQCIAADRTLRELASTTAKFEPVQDDIKIPNDLDPIKEELTYEESSEMPIIAENDLSVNINSEDTNAPKNSVQTWRHKCQLCNKTYVTLHTLRVHVKSHCEIKTERRVETIETDKQVIVDGKNNESLVQKRYRKNQATQVKQSGSGKIERAKLAQYKCSECEYVGVSSNSLLKHRYKKDHYTAEHRARRQRLKIEIRNERGKYECLECGKEYVERKTLHKHQELHQNVSIKCDECGKKFKHAQSLVWHRRSHLGDVYATCHVCGRAYYSAGALSSHVRKHFVEQKHQCDVCHKMLSSRNNLKEHKYIHTGEKPQVCNVCNRRFRRQESLRIHKRIHTDERPYPCALCPKRFRSRQQALLHMNAHH